MENHGSVCCFSSFCRLFDLVDEKDENGEDDGHKDFPPEFLFWNEDQDYSEKNATDCYIAVVNTFKCRISK